MEHTDTAPRMGQAVESLMGAAGVTQRNLSDSTGIPLATLNRSLKGHRSFKFDELARVSIALGVRPSALVAQVEGA